MQVTNITFQQLKQRKDLSFITDNSRFAIGGSYLENMDLEGAKKFLEERKFDGWVEVTFLARSGMKVNYSIYGNVAFYNLYSGELIEDSRFKWGYPLNDGALNDDGWRGVIMEEGGEDKLIYLNLNTKNVSLSMPEKATEAQG